MSVYTELKGIVEATGVPCSALGMPATETTYAVIRMVTHQEEDAGDDQPILYGAYMQVDLFTDADADAKARSIVRAAQAAGYSYRGRSDDILNNKQHVTIRLRRLEVNSDE